MADLLAQALPVPLDPVAWGEVGAALDHQGWAPLGRLLDPTTCRAVASCFDDDKRFRASVDMARHGFGAGRYRYFAEPLPPLVAALRASLYARLAPIANGWAERLAEAQRYPAGHEAFRAMCRAAGQARPTPLLLRYGPGDHNRLHQDLYGPLVFPIQVVVVLDEPGVAFEGGELVLVEGRARRQSRAHVVPLRQGEAVAFAVSRFASSSGRATLRHGVATVRSGLRHSLGIILHDAA